MLFIKSSGDLRRTEKFLKKMKEQSYLPILDRMGEMGVEALKSATPKRTGLTASSWKYEVVQKGEQIYINWYNTNIQNGINIALILQYGHGTGWGGYVQGRDYINPAIRPIFDNMVDAVWKEVTSA